MTIQNCSLKTPLATSMFNLDYSPTKRTPIGLIRRL
jgi:hypothetical protein